MKSSPPHVHNHWRRRRAHDSLHARSITVSAGQHARRTGMEGGRGRMEDDDRRKDGEERLDGRLEIQLLVEEGDVGGGKNSQISVHVRERNKYRQTFLFWLQLRLCFMFCCAGEKMCLQECRLFIRSLLNTHDWKSEVLICHPLRMISNVDLFSRLTIRAHFPFLHKMY